MEMSRSENFGGLDATVEQVVKDSSSQTGTIC